MNRWNQLFYNKLWFIATVASTLHQNWAKLGAKRPQNLQGVYSAHYIEAQNSAYSPLYWYPPTVAACLHDRGAPCAWDWHTTRGLRSIFFYTPSLSSAPLPAFCAVGDVSNWGTPENSTTDIVLAGNQWKHQKDMHIHSRRVCKGCFLLQFRLQSKPCLHKIGQLISEFFRKTSRKGGWWVSLPQRDQTIHSTSTEASNWLQPFVIHLIPPWFEMI